MLERYEVLPKMTSSYSLKGEMLELNRIYCMDALEGMKQIEDKSIDLILTDQPYNISNYGNSLTKKGNKIVVADFGDWDKWDNIEEYFLWCLKWVKEVERILIDNGSFYVFFDNHYADHLTYLIEKETTLRQKTPIILVKNNPIPHIQKTNFRSSFERATLFIKNLDKKPKTFNFLSQKEMCNTMFYNIGQKETEHPTEKPLEIIKRLIRVSSNEGELVLDMFMGSGTTAVACKQLNRNFIGFELEQKYVDIANKRLAQQTLTEVCGEDTLTSNSSSGLKTNSWRGDI